MYIEEARITFEEILAMYEEYERWAYGKQKLKELGHPPKRLLATYNQPVKKIRPCARSFGGR